MHFIFYIALIPYFVILLIISRKLIRPLIYNPVKSDPIKVTVIIPCRNEENNLPCILNDLSQQNFPQDFLEVIIVDDHSTDRTVDTALSFKDLKGLRIINNRGKGKKSAISTAVEDTASELIITTDADCSVGNNWLSTIVSFYVRYKPSMVICPIRLEGRKGIFYSIQELEFLSLQGITAATALSGSPVMCNGANLAFTRNSWLRNRGNLHPEMESGDDIFLLHSLKREGARIMWLHSVSAQALTKPSASIKDFIRQRARWISKAGAYSDPFTNLLAVATFITIISLVYLFLISAARPEFLGILGISLAVKSIPDLAILYGITRFYSRTSLLIWFIPAQILYPFYVVAVVIRSFFANNWR